MTPEAHDTKIAMLYLADIAIKAAALTGDADAPMVWLLHVLHRNERRKKAPVRTAESERALATEAA